METKCSCPFWKICGSAPILQILARQAFAGGGPWQDHNAAVCDDKNKYLECKHYEIWIKLNKS